MEDVSKLAIIGYYLYENIIADIVYFILEYTHLFPCSIFEMKRVRGEHWEMNIELKPDTWSTKKWLYMTHSHYKEYDKQEIHDMLTIG